MGFCTWITTAWLDSTEVVGRYSLTQVAVQLKLFVGGREYISYWLYQTFEKYRGNSNLYKNGIPWLFISLTFWKKDNKKLKVISWQFKVKCQIHRTFLVAYKEALSSCSRMIGNTKDQVQDL